MKVIPTLFKQLDDVGHPFIRKAIERIVIYTRRHRAFIGVNIRIRLEPKAVMTSHDFEEILHLPPVLRNLRNCFQSPTQFSV